MIARIWRGAVRKGDGDAYAEYIMTTSHHEVVEPDGYGGAAGSPAVRLSGGPR